MTREEAIQILKFQRGYFCDFKGCQEQQAFTMAIKALEQQPCDDCISRQVTIKYLCTNMNWHDEDGGTADDEKKLNAITDLVNGVPSVTPQPKTGYWEWVRYDSNSNIGNWHCSECRTIIQHMPEETDNTPIYKWCPMCGAKMIEPQESEG